jgi:hypothetical protein
MTVRTRKLITLNRDIVLDHPDDRVARRQSAIDVQPLAAARPGRGRG